MTQLRKRLIDRVKEAGPFAEPSEVEGVDNLTEIIEAGQEMYDTPAHHHALNLQDPLCEACLARERWSAARKKAVG